MPILNWLTRDEDIRTAQHVPYRLLEEVSDLSAGHGGAGNMLIQGDNLEALKALLPFYAGRVKCIYIAPPYNTGAAFEHYDDNLENSIWLGTIWPRLELLRDLLAEDGSLWVNIDDRQGHYLKVILDEVFGRSRFVANVVWQKWTSRENRKAIGSAHDHILVYAPAGAQDWKKYRNLLPDTDKGYANPDEDPKGPWRSIPFSAQGFRANQMYKIKTPTGDVLDPPKGRCWGATEPEFLRLRDIEGRVYFPKSGRGRPRIKKYQFEESGLAPMTWWTAADFGDNQQAKKEILELFNDEDAFDTPKPEKLIERILHIATNPGAREHRRGLLPVKLRIIILIEQKQPHHRRGHMRQAPDLARIDGAVDVQNVPGEDPDSIRHRDPLVGAVARVTAAEVIRHPPPDPVELDPAADAIAVGGCLGLLEGQHLGLQQLHLQRYQQTILGAAGPQTHKTLARHKHLARDHGLQTVKVGQPVRIGLVRPGKPEPLHAIPQGRVLDQRGRLDPVAHKVRRKGLAGIGGVAIGDHHFAGARQQTRAARGHQ